MDVQPINTTPPQMAAQGVTTPMATPPPMAQPSPAPAMSPTPMMANGGTMQGGIKGFFKSLNWVEVGFMILGATALMFTIQYYRNKLKDDREQRNEQQRQLDEIKMNLQSAMKGKYKSL